MNMSRYIIISAALMVLSLASGYGQGSANLAAVRQAIDLQNQRFAKAYNSHDAAGVAAVYTADATTLPPYSKMLQGRAAIRESNQKEFTAGLKDLRLSTVSLEVHDDFAYEIGKYSITLPPSDGKVMKDSGKYLVIWQKQGDGSWKIYMDIWNSSMPPLGM